MIIGEYCPYQSTPKHVQYNILLGKIFTNIDALNQNIIQVWTLVSSVFTPFYF